MSNHQAYCYCYTCDREIHYLGLPSHRAAHRRRGEDCRIAFSDGKIQEWEFSKLAKEERKDSGENWG